MELIKNQNYKKLLEEHLQQKTLFIDDIFSPESHGDYFKQGKFANKTIDWLRPIEISKNPEFMVETVSRFDVAQGELNDCWFISGKFSKKKMEKHMHTYYTFLNPDISRFKFNFESKKAFCQSCVRKSVVSKILCR